jgi:hypothetical protein
MGKKGLIEKKGSTRIICFDGNYGNEELFTAASDLMSGAIMESVGFDWNDGFYMNFGIHGNDGF